MPGLGAFDPETYWQTVQPALRPKVHPLAALLIAIGARKKARQAYRQGRVGAEVESAAKAGVNTYRAWFANPENKRRWEKAGLPPRAMPEVTTEEREEVQQRLAQYMTGIAPEGRNWASMVPASERQRLGGLSAKAAMLGLPGPDVERGITLPGIGMIDKPMVDALGGLSEEELRNYALMKRYSTRAEAGEPFGWNLLTPEEQKKAIRRKFGLAPKADTIARLEASALARAEKAQAQFDKDDYTRRNRAITLAAFLFKNETEEIDNVSPIILEWFEQGRGAPMRTAPVSAAVTPSPSLGARPFAAGLRDMGLQAPATEAGIEPQAVRPSMGELPSVRTAKQRERQALQSELDAETAKLHGQKGITQFSQVKSSKERENIARSVGAYDIVEDEAQRQRALTRLQITQEENKWDRAMDIARLRRVGAGGRGSTAGFRWAMSFAETQYNRAVDPLRADNNKHEARLYDIAQKLKDPDINPGQEAMLQSAKTTSEKQISDNKAQLKALSEKRSAFLREVELPPGFPPINITFGDETPPKTSPKTSKGAEMTQLIKAALKNGWPTAQIVAQVKKKRGFKTDEEVYKRWPELRSGKRKK